MEYRRAYLPGACYFFTVVTDRRQPLLVDYIDRLRHAFRQVRNKHPFEIQAIVVLPDHLHTLWKLPRGDHDYSSRWMKIKRSFSAGLPATGLRESQRAKREKGIWQRRFWEHLIRDEEDWQRHLDYIHYNPVRHGYVRRAREWPYSSFHRLVAQGWYTEDWGSEVSDTVLDMQFE
ncbi:putative transposase [Microbulbifer donghaiensis]|uniref:Putative transposase n=1 Tax=Microbulbifer donghaiensis TaxID=494016 RepID=A0A1M4YVJ1_9GAMM|nr:transposase [Microbulbifer donghaiensis]SHF09829.1 putative transposase [Microbulbifer donghaiensis]